MTERLLTSNGWLCDITERYNAWGNFSSDFLGVGDFVAVSVEHCKTAAIQVTTFHNRNARRKKILKSISAYLWVLGGNLMWLITWKKVDNVWVPAKEDITEKDFNENFRKRAREYWDLRGRCADQDIKNHKIKTLTMKLR